MLFNSYTFWFFFAIVLFLYTRLSHKYQNRMLLVASYVFYGWWDWRFLSLIFIVTSVNYLSAFGIVSAITQKKKKIFCAIPIFVSLGLLGVFKYYNFFADQVAVLLKLIGLPLSVMSIKVLLPVGISFYTFQSMSYTIDIYRGHTRLERNFWDFALYVSFFPQLVAGPIERSSRLLPQVVNPRTYNSESFREGLYLVLLGLFEKVVIADNMAPIVNAVFAVDPNNLSGLECWAGVYAFAFQIYGDFSGYSTVARGIAKWLGFDLMTNFRNPYFAVSPRDFWKRWHISLSSWLRDYLYIPLGGNRNGKWKTYRNLMITMLLGGLWHGANWTFVAWGFFHGVLLLLYRIFDKFENVNIPRQASSMLHLCRVLIMFHLICIGWIFFRAESIHQATAMLIKMFSDFHTTDLVSYILGSIVFYVGPLLILEFCVERSKDIMSVIGLHWIPRAVIYNYFVLMMFFFAPDVNSEFIYFRF